MTLLSTSEPPREEALQTCLTALRQVAGYVLDPELDERLRDLGERKEFLSEAEHKELMGLVAFTERRTIEKFQAELALKRLLSAFPELTPQP